jgi:hypothetical protein|tara:strand:+ start:856 stop:1473 length:618 start_codon:yes stop_codon:yes gene_type:complete
MKINEIIVSEFVAGGHGTGSSPSSKAARDSESRRANLEYRELKKFSTEFANEFLNQFNLIGRTSVDVAYQKAAITFANREANSKDERDQIINDLKKFRSAMPTQIDKKQKVVSIDRARGAQLGNTNAVRKRGGQAGNTNAVKPAKPGVIKRIRNVVDPVVKAVGDAGKDLGQDWRTGKAFGDKIAGMLSSTDKIAASYKNKNPKI